MNGRHGDHGHEHHGDGQIDVVPDEAFWDERYRATGAMWSGHPNSHLVFEATDVVPGRALDVGCGEGADAIWLAEHDWQATAVDISSVALARGAARATEVGADTAQRITWLHADLIEWDPAAAQYDLVSAQFMRLPTEPRNSQFRRLAASVAPGGTLLIVGHHPSDLQTTAMRPPMPDLFFTGDDVAALLDPHDWQIVVNAARERTTTDPEGRTVTIRDSVLRAERRR